MPSIARRSQSLLVAAAAIVVALADISTQDSQSDVTATASSCPTACSFNGPLITGYEWVPVVANLTLTATVEVLYPTGYNASATAPTASLSAIQTQTVYTDVPWWYQFADVDPLGTVLATVTIQNSDGATSDLVLAYPTNALDYASTFDVDGAMGASPGLLDCSTAASTAVRTLGAHPTYAAVVSTAASDPKGSNFVLVPTTYLDLEFLKSAFPEEDVFSICATPSVTSNAAAVTAPIFVTTSTTDVLDQSGMHPPMTEYTVSSGDGDSVGHWTIFIAHTEFTVPTSDTEGYPKPTSTKGPTRATAMVTNSAGGSKGSSQDHGRDSSTAGAVASRTTPSPSSEAHMGASRPTALPEATSRGVFSGHEPGFDSGSGSGGYSPAQTITVGSMMMPVTHTTKQTTLTRDGGLVPSKVPIVVISGSTVTLGQTITVHQTPVVFTTGQGSGSGSTPSSGDVLVVGGTSTITLTPFTTEAQPGAYESAFTFNSGLFKPTMLSDGDTAYVVGTQTLRQGQPVTIGTGTQTTVVSLTTDAAGSPELVGGTSTYTIAAPTGSTASPQSSGASGSSRADQTGGAGRLSPQRIWDVAKSTLWLPLLILIAILYP